MYLQRSRSLKVVPGSHRRPVPLDSDAKVVPAEAGAVQQVEVDDGDIVLMDIRLVHRGSTEEEMAQTDLAAAAKILVSTVYGGLGTPLARAMQLGNAQRMMDWDARHLAGQKAAVVA